MLITKSIRVDGDGADERLGIATDGSMTSVLLAHTAAISSVLEEFLKFVIFPSLSNLFRYNRIAAFSSTPLNHFLTGEKREL